MKRALLSLLLVLVFISSVQAQQSVIIRGQSGSTVGTYDVLRSDGSGSLNVNITAGTVTTSPGVVTATLTQTTPTVTNTAANILSANAARKSVIIQNNNASNGIVYINFGATATTAHFQIGPGQSLFMNAGLPVTAISAIGSIASNANVVVIEGQ